MASTREERMQQRLRGAQRRQVKDVDFAFDIGGLPALAPPPSMVPTASRRNPRRSLDPAPRSSSRPTSASRSRSQAPVKSPQAEDIPPIARPTAVTPTVSLKHANTSAKRRKLDTNESSISIRNSASAVPVPAGDIYALEMDEALELEVQEPTTSHVEQSSYTGPTAEEEEPEASYVPQTAERSQTPAIEEVEITESPKHAPGSGQRIRKMNGASSQSSRLQDELQIDNAVRVDPAGSPTPQRKRKRTTSNVPSTVKSRRIPRALSEDSNHLNNPDEIDELSPEQLKGGRRRRSSTQRVSLVANNRPSSDGERVTAEEVDDVEVSKVLGRHRSEEFKRVPAEASPELDEHSESVQPLPRKRRNRAKQLSSPAVQRHPKKAIRKPNPSMKPIKQQIRSGSPIAITVHRLTKGPVHDEDESDADILNSEIPYAKRKGVSVVDVLGDLATEIMTSALTDLDNKCSSTEDAILKRDFRNKLRAVEAFEREFRNRLHEHTFNLDNTAALERRIRDEKKKQLGLRADIGRVRKERERIALRKDEVRITHERESKEGQDRDTINTAVHDIEVAVGRGKERTHNGAAEKLGIELLLKRIAGEISNKSSSGGMLHQIKDFNSFLERTALALENRRA